MAEKSKKKLYEVAKEVYLGSQSDAFTPQMLQSAVKNSGYTVQEVLDYMGSEAFQSQIYNETLGQNVDQAVAQSRARSALRNTPLAGGFGGGGGIPLGSDTEQARRASEAVAQRELIGAITGSAMNLPVSSAQAPVQAPVQNTASAPYVEPGTDISRDEREFGPSGQGQFQGLVRIPGQVARQTYEMAKNAMMGGREVLSTIANDPRYQQLMYGPEGVRQPQAPAGVNAPSATAASSIVTSPMAGVGGPSASPAPAPTAQPQPFNLTPGGMGFYLGGSMPSPTQDQGLASIQNAYAQGQLPVPPSQYISMRQQAMREAMQTGQPMVVSGEFPGMVMVGGTPSGGITSAPIDGRGGFDPATARVAKAYNERINQMVAEGKTPTRQEQVQIQRDLVQQERDAQASFEDRFERARAAGLAAGGGAGDPLTNRLQYEQRLAQMGILSPSERLKEERADRAVARREALTIPEKERKAAESAQQESDERVFNTQKTRIVRDSAKAVEDAITGILRESKVERVADLPADQRALVDSYGKYMQSPVMNEIFDSVARLKVAADKGDKNAEAQYREFMRGISGTPQQVLGFLFDPSIDPETGKPRGVYFQY